MLVIRNLLVVDSLDFGGGAVHTDYITAAASAATTGRTTARAGAASDWIVGARVGASVGAEDRVGAVVGR